MDLPRCFSSGHDATDAFTEREDDIGTFATEKNRAQKAEIGPGGNRNENRHPEQHGMG